MNLVKKLSNKKGFTLVELLVVVAIIAILSVIGLTLFTQAQQNARDARRKSDIDSIAKALESSKSSAAYYNFITGTSFSSGFIPFDTTTNQYCIRLYTTVDGAKLESDPTNAWGGTGDSVNCPSAVSGVPWRTARDVGTAAQIAFNATNFPASTYKSWKVCSRLENTTASPNVFCRNSAQ